MKKLLNNVFFSKGAAAVFAALAAVTVLLNYSFRFGYVYIDVTLFSGFSMTLFVIMLLNAVLLTALLALRMKNPEITSKKAFCNISVISELLAIVFAIIVIVNFIVGGGESVPVALKLCKELLPLWATVVSLVSVLFIVPKMNNKTVQKGIAICITAVLAVVTYASIFPVTPYKFTSGPVVFDNGKDYSVVFSTSDNGTAYLEYERDGKTIRIYDDNNGRKVNSRIHAIRVPYEELSGATYKVSSTRVIDELSYGGRLGKTIESAKIQFNDTFGDNVNILTVSDWHTHNEKAKQAVSHLGDYSAVILLGDGAPGLMFTQETEDYILAFGSDLTGGAMPVIFARGNHETRGREASYLASNLGMDEFYYTTHIGNYNFIVLDSGEDKEDSHPEYGGMVNYEEYRRQMVSWLNTLENEENVKTIALSHSEEICIEEDLSRSALAKLNDLNTSLLVSGHMHTSEFKQGQYFPVFVDGGADANGKGSLVASMLSITPEKIGVLSIDNKGETVINETVYWK